MEELNGIIGFFLAGCAAIITVSGAASAIGKAVQAAKRPNDELERKIAKIEVRLDEHDRNFDSDKRKLESIEQGSKVTQRALLALLDHGLDGNNELQMREAKDELQRHLIERG